MAKITNYIRGDSRTITLQVYQADGVTPLNLTGATAFFTVNASSSPADDTAAVIQKTVTTHTAPLLGQTAFSISNTDTQLIAPGTYYYDVQIKDAAGAVVSQKASTIQIIADITRRLV